MNKQEHGGSGRFDIPEDAVAEWLRSIDVGSPATERSYRTGLDALQRWAAEAGLDMDELTEDHLRAFRDDVSGRLSPGTVSTYLTGIRSFYRWADSPSFPDVASGVKGAHSRRGFKKEALTPEEARLVLERCQGESPQELRDFAMVNLMIRTGLRDIEVVRADVGDIDRSAGRRVLLVQGKGRSEKDELVVLSDKAYQPIERYLGTRPGCGPGDPLFASLSRRNPGGRLTTRTVSAVAKRALQAAGINSPRYTAHSLRHTAVTFSLLGGATLEQAQRMARHADITTTMVYSHHVDRIRDAAELKIDNVLDDEGSSAAGAGEKDSGECARL